MGWISNYLFRKETEYVKVFVSWVRKNSVDLSSVENYFRDDIRH